MQRDHANSANEEKQSMQEVKRKQTWRRRNCSGVESVMVARSVFVLLLLFYFCVCFLPLSFLCVSVTLSTDSCTFFSRFCRFYLQKNRAKTRFSCLPASCAGKNVVSSTSSFGKIPSNFYLQSSSLF